MNEKALKAPNANPGKGDSNIESTARCDQRLPRAKKERRRNKSERGLAPDRELQQLAIDFLATQRRLWPGLADTALIPAATDETITCLVEDFKARHRQGSIDPLPKSDESKVPQRLGGFYGRYSCDNSNPKSIADQLVKVLEQAKKCDRFVPWAYVFADYSSSGLSPARQGYSSYKAVLQDPKHQIDTTFIDDFTRASRDEVEWWRLAHLSRRMNKQMIGASDGFDLSNPNSEIMITVFGLVSRLLIKGIREKVRCGMHGAARRGGCLGKPPLGFTRTPRLDEAGQVVRDPNGLPQYVYAVDPEAAGFRRLMYELYVVQGLSFYKIAKRFNELKIDDWSGWNESGIKKMLWSASAVGVFIWNKYRNEYDHERNRIVREPNPRRDWVVHYDPALAVVPLDLWVKARRRLKDMRRASPLTGRKPSRNERCASTLFSGTLYCSYCGKELTLMRAGKYRSLGCSNGMKGAHGCKLSTFKSVTIIESSFLRFLREKLISKEVVADLVEKANQFLAMEAAKPKVDTKPIQSKIHSHDAAPSNVATSRMPTSAYAASRAAPFTSHFERDIVQYTHGTKGQPRKNKNLVTASPDPGGRSVAMCLGNQRGVRKFNVRRTPPTTMIVSSVGKRILMSCTRRGVPARFETALALCGEVAGWMPRNRKARSR